MFNFCKSVVLQKTYTSTQIWTSLAVSDQRFKRAISDILQLLLLKSCLYKYCDLMNNVGSYHIHLFILQHQVLIYPKCCYFPTVTQFNFVLIFVDYNLFRSQLKQAFSILVSLLHIFKCIFRGWFRFFHSVTNFAILVLIFWKINHDKV